MAASPFAFTPVEGVAFETILEERPELVDAHAERLTLILDDLAETCQRRIITEAEANDILTQLRGEFVTG